MKNRSIIIFKLASIVALWVTLQSCNAYREIEVNYDKDRDFSVYKTFAWLPDTDSAGDSEFNNDFIRNKTRNYIGHCMDERDYGVDQIEPDLLLKVTWLDHPREVSLGGPTSFPEYYDPYYYNDPVNFYIYKGLSEYKRPYELSDGKEEKFRYSHGGVVLDVIDRRKNISIWHGEALGDLYDPKILYQDLHPAIHKMMKKFPTLEDDDR